MVSSWYKSLSWRKQRQLILVLIPLVPAILISSYLTYNQINSATCYDGKLNQGEQGIDCEGPCSAICSARLVQPKISQVGAYPTLRGTYNFGAVIENLNSDLGIDDFPITIIAYDQNNNELYRNDVQHDLRPSSKSLIFDGPVRLEVVPDRVVMQMNFDTANWSTFEDPESQLLVQNVSLTGQTTRPKASAEIVNNKREVVRNLPVGALIKNENGEIVSISNSVIDVNGRSTSPVSFTWPAPFPTTKGSCIKPVDLVVAIDSSGSMNDLGDNPPQPITAVKSSASMFASLFSNQDRFGVVSFDSDAKIVLDPNFSENLINRHDRIDSIEITDLAENGYTNLGSALDVGRRLLNSLDEDREQALVVLTDGEPTAPDNQPDPKVVALQQAQLIRADNINLYIIGLGDTIDDGFLSTLTADQSRAFKNVSANQVETIYQQIATSICERALYGIELLPNKPL